MNPWDFKKTNKKTTFKYSPAVIVITLKDALLWSEEEKRNYRPPKYCYNEERKRRRPRSGLAEDVLQVVLVEGDQRHDEDAHAEAAQVEEELRQVALVLVRRTQFGDHVHQGDVDEHAGGDGEHPGARVLRVAKDDAGRVADHAEDAREEVVE